MITRTPRPATMSTAQAVDTVHAARRTSLEDRRLVSDLACASGALEELGAYNTAHRVREAWQKLDAVLTEVAEVVDAAVEVADRAESEAA